MTGIVTGASSGIGLGIAGVLAEAGARVYAFSRTGSVKAAGEDTHSGDGKNLHRGDGENPHRNIIHKKVDLCNYLALKEAVKEIANCGGLDFLINNAGVTAKCRAEDFKDEDFASIQQLNVNSVFKLSCLCYPYLKTSSYMGRIINITSMAAHLGFSEVVPYCTSKGAVLAMTRGLAVEWANDNITVNSIAPGWFPSEMSKQVMDEERKRKILSRMPVHKFGDTRDIGAMACFLLSDGANYITGQDFAVDGGALAFGF